MMSGKSFFKLGQRASRALRFAAIVAAICVATGATYADTTIAANMTLSADADWRADGVVTVPQGVTVDLNGHALQALPRDGRYTLRSNTLRQEQNDQG